LWAFFKDNHSLETLLFRHQEFGYTFIWLIAYNEKSFLMEAHNKLQFRYHTLPVSPLQQFGLSDALGQAIDYT
jgi:hypothetical protein